VVNGEGSIHHGRGNHLIAVLGRAQALGLPTALVNAVLQDDDHAAPVLRRLHDCTVRDAASSEYLTRLDVTHRVVFDSMLEADFSAQARVDLAGKVVVTDWHGGRHDVAAALTGLLASLGNRGAYYPLENAERAGLWRHAVADFTPARLIVTGRHHGVCLAALAGVPFVACGSNTWKVEGLLALLPGGRTVTAPESVADACARPGDQGLARETHAWVMAQRPLTTFDRIRRVA
jgi:hypothetical protein